MGNLKDIFWENVISKVNRQENIFSSELITKIKESYDKKGIVGVEELFNELDKSIDIGRELDEN